VVVDDIISIRVVHEVLEDLEPPWPEIDPTTSVVAVLQRRIRLGAVLDSDRLVLLIEIVDVYSARTAPRRNPVRQISAIRAWSRLA